MKFIITGKSNHCIIHTTFIYIYIFFFSDNLRFGLQFSRKFVDGSEPNRPDNFKTTKQKRIWSNRLKMNLHNNEVGRQVIQAIVILFSKSFST